MQKDVMGLTQIPASEKDEDLPNYIAYDKVAGKKSIFEVTNMLPEEHMFEIMSTCHSLTIVDGKLIGIFASRNFKENSFILFFFVN